MKKTLSLILALTFVLALFAACGGGNTGGNTGGGTAATQPPAQTQAPSGGGSGSGAAASQPKPEGWDFSDATKVNLVFAIFSADQDNTTKAHVGVLEAIKEYTQGTVDYTLYAGATLCAADEQLESVRQGFADVAMCSTANHAGALPFSFILEYPAVHYANDKATACAFNDWQQQLQLEEFKDFKLMYIYGQGNGSFTSTTPLRNFEDFKGKSIRTTAALFPLMEAYGFVPTAMPITECYEAMRSGVVDGATSMFTVAVARKFYEVAKYYVMDPYYVASMFMVMNMDTWNSLTPDQKEAVDAATEFGFDEYVSWGRQADVAADIKTVEANGAEVIYLADDVVARMGEISAPLQESYAASIPGGTAALELLRELAAKWNAIYPEFNWQGTYPEYK